jgi:hypothetical protein
LSDFDLPAPNLERRIMPLLDVALTLVGLLLLLIMISSQEPTSDSEGNVINLLAAKDGTIRFEEMILFDGSQTNETVWESLIELVNEKERPLVLFHYFLPDPGQDQAVKETEVIKIQSRLSDTGADFRIVRKGLNEQDSTD